MDMFKISKEKPPLRKACI